MRVNIRRAHIYIVNRLHKWKLYRNKKKHIYEKGIYKKKNIYREEKYFE